MATYKLADEGIIAHLKGKVPSMVIVTESGQRGMRESRGTHSVIFFGRSHANLDRLVGQFYDIV